MDKKETFLNNFIKGNNFIYGAGCWGNLFYQYCKRHNIDISGYIVTSISGNEITNGLDIYLIDEYSTWDDEKKGNLVICIYYPEQIELELKKRKISKYYVLSQDILIDMSKEMSSNYFIIQQGNAENQTFFIKGMKFLNPYIVDKEYFWEYFTDSMDIIFPNELGVFDFINEGPYEYQDVLLCAGDVVLDLGASLGVFSQLAINKGCTVYAFEPAPKSYAYLKRLNAVFGKCGLFLFQYGIADYSGKHDFYTGGKSIGFDGFRPLSDLTDKIEVDVVTVDDFVKEQNIDRVDFIKANIEGAERLMLDGAKETIRRFHPKLSLRTNHYPDDPEVLENKIKSIDERYHVVHKWKQLYAWI